MGGERRKPGIVRETARGKGFGTPIEHDVTSKPVVKQVGVFDFPSLWLKPLSMFVQEGGEQAFALSADFEFRVSGGGVGIAGAFLEEV